MFRLIKPTKLRLPESANIYVISAAYVYYLSTNEQLPKTVKQRLLTTGKREYNTLKLGLQNTLMAEQTLTNLVDFGKIKRSNSKITVDMLSRHSLLYDSLGIIAIGKQGTGVFLSKRPRNTILTDDPNITDFDQIENLVINELSIISEVLELQEDMDPDRLAYRSVVYTLINPLTKAECQITYGKAAVICEEHYDECPYEQLVRDLYWGMILEPRSHKAMSSGGEYVIPVGYLDMSGVQAKVDPIAEPGISKVNPKVEARNKLSIPKNSKFDGKHRELADNTVSSLKSSVEYNTYNLNILTDEDNPYLEYLSAASLEYLREDKQVEFYNSVLEDFGGRSRLNAKLKQLADYSSIYMLAPLTAVYDIIDSGSRIKSASELDNINTELNEDALVMFSKRSALERDYFGTDREDVHSFPKYGFLGTTNRPYSLITVAKKDFAFAEFGTTLLEFKPEVKARSTFNVGDTGLSPSKAYENIMTCPIADINIDVFSLLMLEKLPRVKELMKGFNTGTLNFINFLVNLDRIKVRQGLDFKALTENVSTNTDSKQLNIRAHYIETQIFGKLGRDDIKSIYSEEESNLQAVDAILKNNKLRGEISLHNYMDEIVINRK